MTGSHPAGKNFPRALLQGLSLRWKTLIVILPLIFLTLVVFTLLHIHTNQSYLITNTENFLASLAHQLSFSIGRGYEIDNSRSLYRLVKEYMAYDSRILGISVINQDKEITADSNPEKIFAFETDPGVAQVLAGGGEVLRRYSKDGQDLYQFIVPIYVWETHKVNGTLVLKYDVTQMFRSLRKLQMAVIFWSALLLVLLAIGITLFLERNITRPLGHLTRVVSGVNILNPVAPDLDIKTKDEIGTLARTFTNLLDNLRRTQAKLTQRTAEIEQAYQQLQETQMQLVQSEKLASLGQLTAGIAHEVNNPMNFVYGNLGLIEEYFHAMHRLLQAYQTARIDQSSLKAIRSMQKQVDYEAMVKDMTGILADCKTGAKRTLEIVKNLRDFSRMDSGEIQTIDLNESLDTTLNLLKQSYKDRIEVIKHYAKLPPYSCYSGQINQVLMNILMNAIQAIEDRGTIEIKTACNEETLSIAITDTGQGIPEQITYKVFDPFFTTKEIGEGTGLGLSISYRIVKEHGGNLSFESQVGKGTCMRIELPIHGVTTHDT
ncbi:MAG: ATP-binding protein [bacterium]